KMSVPTTISTHAVDLTNELIAPESSYLISKRVFDIALILFFSPIIIPLMLITAVLIKLEEPSASVFFWQKRVGAQGKAFNMIKFRSMTTDSEKHGSQFAQASDKRITRLGRFTRKMRIDELPQLLNIIRGEMSLIGPRPEQVLFVEEFAKTIPNYGDRHHVLPGITGLAQIKQGYVDDANGTRTKLAYDLYYIENISFLMDIRIALQTLHTMATGFGAR
ncbi:MAG: sugar transferase, partial [Cocleimonas sp.]|nr:sugar transferase [Cocleimonas sp.]